MTVCVCVYVWECVCVCDNNNNRNIYYIWDVWCSAVFLLLPKEFLHWDNTLVFSYLCLILVSFLLHMYIFVFPVCFMSWIINTITCVIIMEHQSGSGAVMSNFKQNLCPFFAERSSCFPQAGDQRWRRDRGASHAGSARHLHHQRGDRNCQWNHRQCHIYFDTHISFQFPKTRTQDCSEIKTKASIQWLI